MPGVGGGGGGTTQVVVLLSGVPLGEVFIVNVV